ncbi:MULTISPECIES: tRNA pseudouridine(55) synthase TruB [unclassified Helicobacter]|uniref:tRNA pseudouridine(55) synthase TruB n=1 Tax=unclassified Helicobacter TaxID=2593540 RepID=UPI000CF15568|nr:MULTISPECIES: tRNA pseudouridine(55) synthase TruB [unclassified Helicobacter]
MHNLILVGYKPIFMSSNSYLSTLKRKYQIKSGGYFGTLDPFAKGAMIIAFGQYTKLFSHIKSDRKIYRATLWLGALSESLDIENVIEIKQVRVFERERIEEVLKQMQGKIEYFPPKFSAKHIQGKRAYDLARKGISFELKKEEMEIFDIRLINYMHPFLTFEVCVSKGAYVRSIGEMIAKMLGVNGALCMLERIQDGGFFAIRNKEKILNPLEVLKYPLLNNLSGEIRKNIENGRKFFLKKVQNGFYVANFDDFFSIIEVKEDGQVKYILNRITKC